MATILSRGLIRRLNLTVWIPAGFVFLVGAGLSWSANNAVRRSRDLVVHSHQVLESGRDLLLAVDDAETGQRGYLITGSPDYLAPYRDGRVQATTALDNLERLVRDNNVQASAVRDLRRTVAVKLDELASVVALFDRNGFEAARRAVATNTGKASMDELRNAVRTINDVEAALLTTRNNEVARNERYALFAAALAAALSFVTRTVLLRYAIRRAR